MREEVSLLLETVRQWVELGPDALLLYSGGSTPAAQIPLERRVLGLLAALRQASLRGERRQLKLVLPTSAHPLCAGWSSLPTMRRLVRRLATGSVGLAWLDESPARWTQLRDAAVWLSEPAALASVRATAIAVLRDDPRAAGLPPALVLEYLAAAIQQAPEDAALKSRAVDDVALRRVLSAGPEGLAAWAMSTAPARRELRRLALSTTTHEALVCAQPQVLAPHSTDVRWPSQMLCSEAEVVPFQGDWALEAALLEWCAAPEMQSARVLVAPPGAGKRRVAHELRQHLHTLGWSSCVLGPDDALPPDTGTAQLVVIPDVGDRLGAVQAMLAGTRRSRLRVLGLAAGAGTWSGALPAESVLRLSPIPAADRSARLRVAAAAIAQRSGQSLPWIMAVPDLGPMRWPMPLQLAALASLRGRADGNPVQGALEVERRAWRRAGVDVPQMTALLAAAALGAGPWPGSYTDAPLPAPLAALLVAEVLEQDDALLQAADPAVALPLLDTMAETMPAARGWMRVVLEADPEARRPLAARIVSARTTDPRSRPLGGLLMELGHVFAVKVESIPPIRALTVHFSRQVLGAWHAEPEGANPALAMAANAGGRPSGPPQHTATPAPLAEAVWEHIRRRLDVILPHQIRALDLLDQEHRGSPHESLARQRIALLVELCPTMPEAVVHLEAAINDLGALLSAGQLSPEDAPLSNAGLSDSERQQARDAHRQLHEAFAFRGARNNKAAIHALSEAARLLRGLSQRHPALIASDLLHTTLEMAALGRSLGRPREAAATLQALLAPLKQLAPGQAPHWPRRSTILGNLALLHVSSGDPLAAARFAQSAVDAAPASDTSPSGRLDRIAALRVLLLCGGDDGHIDARWAEVSHLIEALAHDEPALFQPYLAADADLAARRATDPAQKRQHLETAAVSLDSLSALNADLYAPFQGLSLHNLGARLWSVGAYQMGTDVTLDAAEAFRRQARLGGETFLPDLSTTLSNLGAMLATDHKLDPALALVRKSIGVSWGGAPAEALARMPSIRRLLIEQPTPLPGTLDTMVVRAWMREGTARRRPYFLWHLSLLAAALAEGDGDLGDRIASVWRFEVSRPEQLRPGLAAALHNLGVLLGLGGQTAAGAEALEGAAAVLRVLYQDQPEQTGRDLALALADLSALRDLLEDAVAAEAAAAEALSLLAPDDTEARAQALLNQSAALLVLGRHTAAFDCALSAAEASRGVAAVRAAALHNLAAAALGSDRPKVAFDASRDALRIAPIEIPAGQRALLEQTHQRAARAAGREPAA